MKLLTMFAGAGIGLVLAGCGTNDYYSGWSSDVYGSSYGTQKSSSSYSDTKAAKTSSVKPAGASSSSVAPSATTPASPSIVVAPATTPKTASPALIQLPATPVAVTNVVSVTNKVNVLSDVEVVNGQHRRAHLVFKGKATEEGFLKIVAQKQSVMEDVRVIGKLYQETSAQQARFSSALEEQFAMKPEKSYQYDADTMTINEVMKQASEGEAAKIRAHMKLKDEAAAQTFARLVAAKRMTIEQMANLQLINREKQMELAEYDRQLADAYAIVKDRNYQYDAETRTLYELIQLPAGVEMPKAGGTVPVK